MTRVPTQSESGRVGLGFLLVTRIVNNFELGDDLSSQTNCRVRVLKLGNKFSLDYRGKKWLPQSIGSQLLKWIGEFQKYKSKLQKGSGP